MSRPSSDVRYRPAYTVAEAARYLKMPASTLRTWVLGRKNAKPLISLDDPRRQYLSFVNLVESHVLAAIRRKHEVQLPKVRRALGYVESEFGIDRPLIHQEFQTDGLDLFVERYGEMINASREGQRAIREIVCVYLQRIEWDGRGLPIRLYPFTRTRDTQESPRHDPSLIVFEPEVSFGRPVIKGTGIPVEEIVSRFQAGDSFDDIVGDFRVNKLAVEEALRYQPAA